MTISPHFVLCNLECHWRPWGESGGDEDWRPGTGGEAEGTFLRGKPGRRQLHL